MWAVWKTYGPGEQNPHEGPMMFTISKQTKAAFEKQMTTDFENRLVTYLKQSYRERLKEIPEESVRRSVQEGIARAAAYDIKAEHDVARFVDLMYLMSRDFDTNPNTSWIHPVLKNTQIPAGKRMDMIHERASAENRHNEAK